MPGTPSNFNFISTASDSLPPAGFQTQWQTLIGVLQLYCAIKCYCDAKDSLRLHFSDEIRRSRDKDKAPVALPLFRSALQGEDVKVMGDG